MRHLGKHVLPQALFEAPQVGRLAHEGGAVQPAQRGEEVRVVLAEVGEQGAILLQPQVLAHHFHRDHLAIGQHRLRAALAQATAFQHLRHGLVNDAKHGDNEVVQVHGALLRSMAMVPEDCKLLGPGLLLSKPAHRVSYDSDDQASAIHHAAWATNTLTAILRGSQVICFINDIYVGSVEDLGPQSGRLGFSVEGLGVPVAFSDFTIYPL